jgi:hypothetical protein
LPVDRNHPFYESNTTAQVASPHTQENKVLRPARSGTSMTSPSHRSRQNTKRREDNSLKS